MSNEENLYARIITGDLTEKEITALKENGEWDVIQKILKTSEAFTLPPLDKKENVDKILTGNINNKKDAPIRRISIKTLSAVAAGITIVVCVLLFNINRSTSLTTDQGMTLEYDFEDGSIVHLNADTKVRFKKKNWSNNRTVFLNGEAHFSVEKGNPFVVQSKLGQVKVIGTKFNVKTHNNRFSVECYEGKVEVQFKNISKILEKNNAAYFDIDGKLSESDIPVIQSSWLNGVSRFREENLSYVLKEFERQFDVKVESSIDDMIFTGTFENNNLEVAALQISKPLGLTFKLSEDRKKISFTK